MTTTTEQGGGGGGTAAASAPSAATAPVSVEQQQLEGGFPDHDGDHDRDLVRRQA